MAEEIKFKLTPVDEVSQLLEPRVSLFGGDTPISFTLEKQPSETTVKDAVQRVASEYYPYYRATDILLPKPVNYTTNPGNIPLYPQPTIRNKDVEVEFDKVYVSLDFETSGTKPWESRLLGVGAIVIGADYSELFQKFSFDEEEVINNTLDYLDDTKPDALVAHNLAFECQWMAAKCMYFQLQCPWLMKCELLDTQILLKHGTFRNIASSMAAGSEENWINYVFGMEKPYQIDECFEGVARGSLFELQMRNKVCVIGVAELFKVFCWMLGVRAKIKKESLIPSTMAREESATTGTIMIQCPVCKQVQAVRVKQPGQKCFVCGNELPVVSVEQALPEASKEFPFEEFSASLKKSSSKK